MSIKPEEIKEMNTGIERYNPNHIQELAVYLDQQVEQNSYDKDANLALLKLIQFGLENDSPATAYHFLLGQPLKEPEDIQQYDTTWKVFCPVVYKLLIKALMQMPRAHFSLMKSLINYEYHPEQQRNTSNPNYDELVGWAIWIYELLDSCHFEKFWQEIDTVPQRVAPFKGFKESIRQYICYTIGITFQHVDSDYAMKLLGLATHGELQKWCKKHSWTVKGNEIYCGSQQDKVKTRNITEKLSLQMTSMQEALALGITERGLPQSFEAGKN